MSNEGGSGVDRALKPPPGFEEAGNLRQKVRASGMDPDYWYAVEEVRRIRPGTVVEVVFWKRSIALYRATDGSFHALENRCAHRQLKLSLGLVEGCRLVCAYHGWKYDPTGELAETAHERIGKSFPQVSIRTWPVKVRYGLVWLFPGDPALAEKRTIPDIPELEGPGRWACVPLSFTWSAHHSMIIDNVSDFTHAFLHRKYRPFEGAKLTRCETVGDDVHGGLRHLGRTRANFGALRRSQARGYEFHETLFSVPLSVVEHRRTDQALAVRSARRRAHDAGVFSCSISSR